MKKSQRELVLKYLQTHKTGITPLQAMEKFGVERLAARISDLKEDGHPIVKNMVVVKNRFGDKCRVAQYRLVER